MTEYQEMKSKTFSIMQEDGEKIEILGDDLFKLPDGKLTTMYHYLKSIESNSNNVGEVIEETEEVNAWLSLIQKI